jgi:hypothetical protein
MIKSLRMSRACSMYGVYEEFIQISVGNCEGNRGHAGDLGLEGKATLKLNLHTNYIYMMQ